MVAGALVVVALAVTSLATTMAPSLGLGSAARRPTTVPPLTTPRLRALWGQDQAAGAANASPDDDFGAPDDDAPVLTVLKAGGLPEEPPRHDLEQAMEKVRPRVEQCQSLEQFVGIVQVHLVIERSGGVKSAQAVAPLDETQTGQCVAKAARSALFPRFRGTLTPTIELVFPFYFRPADN